MAEGAAYSHVIAAPVAAVFTDLLQVQTRRLFVMKLRVFDPLQLIRRLPGAGS